MNANNGMASKNTMRAIKLGLAGVAMLAAVGQAQAGAILYYVDYVLGTDYMAQALSNRASSGDTVTTVSNASSFQTALTSGGYSLANNYLYIVNEPTHELNV